ncbi:hypothetical protein DICVIV_05537 [Dictyocaulus viviparus]|uniref:Uncharacterized protein n=1 Tax=Dictyocaulus viviparus TaxID=29172 RepID=A0A0D8Y188_DICVI|nr:hypothetical protein DICVIV_05537 [Dictyocaulus viviparus]
MTRENNGRQYLDEKTSQYCAFVSVQQHDSGSFPVDLKLCIPTVGVLRADYAVGGVSPGVIDTLLPLAFSLIESVLLSSGSPFISSS